MITYARKGKEFEAIEKDSKREVFACRERGC